MGRQAARKNKNKIKNKSTAWVLRLLFVVVFASVAGVSILGFMSHSELQAMRNTVGVYTIYNNIFINGINVGGLTPEVALEKVNQEFGAVKASNTVTVKAQGDEITLHFADMGLNYNFSQAVEQAFQYARQGSLRERFDRVTALNDWPHEITYEPGFTFNEQYVRSKLQELSEKLTSYPQNASMEKVDGQFVITPEVLGRDLDIEATFVLIQDSLSLQESVVVDAEMYVVQPEFRTYDLERSQSLLGTFTTSFTGDMSLGRNVNVQNASSKINGYVVFPDEVFSTNAAFGAMTYENGYRMAPIILNNRFVDGMGGGVCQVSTTLYIALLYAELEIVERLNHSQPVTYVDFAFDATLAGDIIDLRFRNDTDYPIYIESYLYGNQITVNIFGHETRNPTRQLYFRNALVGAVHPYDEIVTYDPSLPYGQRVVDVRARTGYRYHLYKIVYENGTQIDRVRVNISNYRAIRGEVRVGTGQAPSGPAPSEYTYTPAETGEEQAYFQPEMEMAEAQTQDAYEMADPAPPTLEELEMM